MLKEFLLFRRSAQTLVSLPPAREHQAGYGIGHGHEWPLFSRCSPGFYDVFVSAMVFTPTAAKVRVKEGQATTLSRPACLEGAGLGSCGRSNRA